MSAPSPFQDRALLEAEAAAPAPFAGNVSGILPAGDKVLVIPDNIEKVTSGGIIIPETHIERSQMARTLGTFVEAGACAWEAWSVRDWAKPGDRVMFGRYAGMQVTGKDGMTYRILNDIDITAIVEPGVTVGGSEL